MNKQQNLYKTKKECALKFKTTERERKRELALLNSDRLAGPEITIKILNNQRERERRRGNGIIFVKLVEVYLNSVTISIHVNQYKSFNLILNKTQFEHLERINQIQLRF